MTLGFAGLGLMGEPMASRLVAAGSKLHVYNRSASARDRIAALGAIPHADPGSLFAASDTIILMLADDAATDAVLARGTEDFRRRVSGRLLVNMGTHSCAWSEALARDVANAGGRFVEAPVSGSASVARSGDLVAMLAGAPEDMDAAEPLLAPLCRSVVRTGVVPSALACKLSVNLYLISSVAALAEAAQLAGRLGVDLEGFAHVIGTGPLGSDVARTKLEKMVARHFSPQASIRDVCKNADLVAGAAASVGLGDGLHDRARLLFDRVRAAGDGDLDMAAVITAYDPREDCDAR